MRWDEKAATNHGWIVKLACKQDEEGIEPDISS
jgi:hypothetical protein